LFKKYNIYKTGGCLLVQESVTTVEAIEKFVPDAIYVCEED